MYPPRDVTSPSHTQRSRSGKSAPKTKRVALTANARKKFLEAIAAGYSKKAAAEATGHDSRVWRRWLAAPENEELRDAVEAAYQDGTCVYEDLLLKAAYGGNIAAIIFALKNRAPQVWRDRHEIVGIPETDVKKLAMVLAEIAGSSTSAEERLERVDEALAELAGEAKA